MVLKPDTQESGRAAPQNEDWWTALLAEEEKFQAEIISAFLPEQMSPEALGAFLRKLISDLGATGTGDLGKVMGAASKALAGKADGKTISQMVRQLLS
jgi:uncharacterized protein YqeY